MFSHCNKQDIMQPATAEWDSLAALACLIMHRGLIVEAQKTHIVYDFWAQQAKQPTGPAGPISSGGRIAESSNRRGAHFGLIAESPGPAPLFGVIRPTLSTEYCLPPPCGP
jgi:hypothetical protein